jgi:transaldolase
MLDTPLLRTARLGPTDYWNDSCAAEELGYAIERGATGATSNPTIVLDVLGKEKVHWVPRVLELAAANRTWSEVELTWAIVEEMAVRGAGMLAAVHSRESGRKGWLSVQVNPANYDDPERMVDQAVRFAGLAPNLQVKFPATSAGILAIEEATARGVNVNATVSFTVSQALAAADAVERGLDRLAAGGGDPQKLAPIVTLMIGRLDDWLKVVVNRDGLSVDPAALDWAGIATFKRTYGIFKERGYRSRMLAAAYRHHLHWTELVGGQVSLTIPYAWQVRFNDSGIEPVSSIDEPVNAALVAELREKLPDFRRAFEPDGLTPAEFDTYGATVRTLRSFIKAYHDLQAAIRDIVLPNPDVRTA